MRFSIVFDSVAGAYFIAAGHMHIVGSHKIEIENTRTAVGAKKQKKKAKKITLNKVSNANPTLFSLALFDSLAKLRYTHTHTIYLQATKHSNYPTINIELIFLPLLPNSY